MVVYNQTFMAPSAPYKPNNKPTKIISKRIELFDVQNADYSIHSFTDLLNQVNNKYKNKEIFFEIQCSSYYEDTTVDAKIYFFTYIKIKNTNYAAQLKQYNLDMKKYEKDILNHKAELINAARQHDLNLLEISRQNVIRLEKKLNIKNHEDKNK